MDPLDVRVGADPIFHAFGVSAVITRPAPNDTPIATSVVWMSWVTEDAIQGMQLQRRQPRRVLAVRHDEVPPLPTKTVVEAAEVAGGTVKRWRVDGLERQESDVTRYIVIYSPDSNSIEAEL